MKKLFFIMLLVTILVFSFAACKNSNNNADNTQPKENTEVDAGGKGGTNEYEEADNQAQDSDGEQASYEMTEPVPEGTNTRYWNDIKLTDDNKDGMLEVVGTTVLPAKEYTGAWPPPTNTDGYGSHFNPPLK